MTLIETNFTARTERPSRPAVRPSTTSPVAAPNTEPTRALVTLSHNSDRRTVEAALQRNGYLVRSTNESAAAEVMMRAFEPDFLIADAREAFPHLSPLLAQVRRCPDVYIIVVGANSADQRITALRNGADDAVPGDISPDEIALRCQAMMRRPRRGLGHGSSESDAPKHLYFGPLSIDLGRREIRIDRHVIAATRLEYDLFVQLCQRPLEVCSRSQLLESVWGPHWVGDTHVVDVHLSNLRRKLNEYAPKIRFMHTVRGIGFRLHDDLLRVASQDLASSRLLEARSA